MAVKRKKLKVRVKVRRAKLQLSIFRLNPGITVSFYTDAKELLQQLSAVVDKDIPLHHPRLKPEVMSSLIADMQRYVKLKLQQMANDEDGVELLRKYSETFKVELPAYSLNQEPAKESKNVRTKQDRESRSG